MSNLFARQSDSSGSESGSEAEQESKQNQQQEDKEKDEKKKIMKAFDSSDDSEGEQRVVRTQKDKRQEVFDKITAGLKNHLNINDFSQIIEDFEKYAEEIKNSSHLLFAGAVDGVLPLYIIRTFAHIDKALNEVTSE